MQSYIYILKLDNGQYYIGSTTNIDRRIEEHKKGIKAGTRYSKNIELVFQQEYNSFSDTRKVEHKLKKMKSRKIIEKIIEDGTIKLIISS